MSTNPFPAILLAGPPHSGKSVLSFLLTDHLRKMRVPHYLLRAAPDYEGDWYLEENLDTVHLLRLRNKRGFTPQFVAQQLNIIQNRWLPLLVDIGGKPQGDQFDIIRACTHSILLYRDQEDYTAWRRHLDGSGLLPVAELRSQQDAADQMTSPHPLLTGVITGLDRTLSQRRAGTTFGALLDRVAGIFKTDEPTVENLHLAHAPLAPLLERDLARELSIPVEKNIYWEPQHLTQLQQNISASQPYALYGRGPVWLAAMLATHALPAPYAFFDARFGWLETPPVRQRGSKNQLDVTYHPYNGCLWAEIRLPTSNVLEPGPISFRAPPVLEGVVLSGKLPRWAFAALARAFAKKANWVAVDEPKKERAVVVFSRIDELPLGSLLPRLTE